MSAATPQQSKQLPAQQQNRQLSPIEAKENGIVKFIASKSKKLVTSLAGSGFSWEQFARLAISTMRKNPALLSCTPESILNAMCEAAQSRLRIDGITGHAYLVPYKTEAVLIPGYKGLIELARRSDEIKSICCEVVCEGDIFDYELGDEPFVKHKPQGVSDKITHAYVCFNLKGGGKVVNVWTYQQCMAHGKKYSPSFTRSDSMWVKHPRIACMKTVIRDSINRGMVPMSVEAQKLSMRDELIEHMQTKEREPTGKVDDIESLTEFLLAGPDGESQSPEASAEASKSNGVTGHATSPTAWKEIPGLSPELFTLLMDASTEAEVEYVFKKQLEAVKGNDEQEAVVQTACDGRKAELRASQPEQEQMKETKGKKGQKSLVE
jgi:recombination protein RecT